MSTLKSSFEEDIPKSINAYNIDKEFRQGLFSTEFLGTNKYTDEQVCIKIYSKENIRRNTAALKFINGEIFSLKLVHHKSFPQLLEFFETNSHIFIVTDLPKGKTIENILKEKKTIAESEAKKIFYKIVEAMTYLHSIFICHRYIHPSNIYYDEASGDIKIVNFFYSKFYEANDKQLNEDIGHPTFCYKLFILLNLNFIKFLRK